MNFEQQSKYKENRFAKQFSQMQYTLTIAVSHAMT